MYKIFTQQKNHIFPIYLYCKVTIYNNYCLTDKIMERCSHSVPQSDHKMLGTSTKQHKSNVFAHPINKGLQGQCQVNITVQNSDLSLLGN